MGADWVVDTEFVAAPGELPEAVCLVARNLRERRTQGIWLADGNRPQRPFYDDNDVVVAFAASAECGVFRSLGWPPPRHVVDLRVVARARHNGDPGYRGGKFSLIEVCANYGLAVTSDERKDRMRERILQGPPYDAAEAREILAYCHDDVRLTAALYTELWPAIVRLGFERVLRWSRFAGPSCAEMEGLGVPIDVHLLGRLRDRWDELLDRLISEVNQDLDVYQGRRFKFDRFAAVLQARGVTDWPRTQSGRLATDERTMSDMARRLPWLADLHELQKTLKSLSTLGVTVGHDGRNRTPIWPFSAKTSRSQPSSAAAVFHNAKWVRGLIRPPAGMALAYLDYSGQEYAIAAALSGDPGMIEDYSLGDPYIGAGVRGGILPKGATKSSHPLERARLKTAIGLGVLYGAGAQTVAQQLGCSISDATRLLDMHCHAFPRFWRWRDTLVADSFAHGIVHTVLGWPRIVGPTDNRRSIANAPIQGTASDILREAILQMQAAGIRVLIPIHDAVLIEAPDELIDDVAAEANEIMVEAADAVLGRPGVCLRVGVTTVRDGEHYYDEGGDRFFLRIVRLLDEIAPASS